MKSYRLAFAATLLIITSALHCGCTKPDTPVPPAEEDDTCFFIYDGYRLEINSAVRYEKGDNSVEIWLSPDHGLTTTSQIGQSGDYVVINTHVTYLGSRDRFNGATSKNSFIRFGGLEYAYGDKGTAYIEADIKGDELTLDFLAEALYTRSDSGPAIMLKGQYKGGFTTETEKEYENEWGFDRERSELSSAIYTTREDGGPASIDLLDKNNTEAISVILNEKDINKTFKFTAADKVSGLKLTYNGGVELSLDGASGTIITSLNENSGNISVSIDILRDGRQFRAEYAGAYVRKIVKLNRYDYFYEGSSQYIGKHEIVKLMVVSDANSTKFYFSPNEAYNTTYTDQHMPILTVPTSIINAGRKSFLEMSGWEFAFDMMQVWPYDNDYKPHPSGDDWIEIRYEDGMYEVEFILSGSAIDMKGSRIDLYYKGEARK